LFQESRIEVIPYGIDTEIYRPIDQPIARNLLKLPQDRKIILFSAFNTTKDPRKGFAQLEAALRLISQTSWGEHISLLVCGSSKPPQGIELEVPIHFLGRLNDDISIALAYSAADLFVAPSMQDNLPNTVMESLACGTPCVAFKVGGMPDLIDHQVNGYLAKPFEVDDLAQGIIWILEKLKQETFLRQAAREKVEREFCLELQAKRYMALFEELLSNPGDR
jgi:glycosyltransferase involved in cell wall biosynthesis